MRHLMITRIIGPQVEDVSMDFLLAFPGLFAHGMRPAKDALQTWSMCQMRSSGVFKTIKIHRVCSKFADSVFGERYAPRGMRHNVERVKINRNSHDGFSIASPQKGSCVSSSATLMILKRQVHTTASFWGATCFSTR